MKVQVRFVVIPEKFIPKDVELFPFKIFTLNKRGLYRLELDANLPISPKVFETIKNSRYRDLAYILRSQFHTYLEYFPHRKKVFEDFLDEHTEIYTFDSSEIEKIRLLGLTENCILPPLLFESNLGHFIEKIPADLIHKLVSAMGLHDDHLLNRLASKSDSEQMKKILKNLSEQDLEKALSNLDGEAFAEILENCPGDDQIEILSCLGQSKIEDVTKNLKKETLEKMMQNSSMGLKELVVSDLQMRDAQEKRESDERQGQLSLASAREDISFKHIPENLDEETLGQLKKAIENDDFKDLILLASLQIQEMGYEVSQEVSNMVEMAKLTMTEDNIPNRIVCLIHFLVKLTGLPSEQDRANLMLAAFFHNFGMTQIKKSIGNYVYEDLKDSEREIYFKHPKLTTHLIRKSGYTVEDECKQIILDHHERYGGTGYPNKKTESEIHPLSQFLGIVEHCVHYGKGKISREPSNLLQTSLALKNKERLPYLEMDFPEDLINSIFFLLHQKDFSEEIENMKADEDEDNAA